MVEGWPQKVRRPWSTSYLIIHFRNWHAWKVHAETCITCSSWGPRHGQHQPPAWGGSLQMTASPSCLSDLQPFTETPELMEQWQAILTVPFMNSWPTESLSTIKQLLLYTTKLRGGGNERQSASSAVLSGTAETDNVHSWQEQGFKPSSATCETWRKFLSILSLFPYLWKWDSNIPKY